MDQANQHKIRVLIVEDEQYARDELEYLLSGYTDIQIVGKLGSAKDILGFVQHSQPHLIFLDIRMPGVDGIQAAEKLGELPLPPFIVFATAHEEFAVKAFEMNAVDYLLKPFSAKRVSHCVERVRRQLNASLLIGEREIETFSEEKPPMHNLKGKLAVEENGRAVILDTDKILFSCCSDGELLIYTMEKVFKSTLSLQDLQSRLDEGLFFRAHRAYLVNVEKIREIIPWFNGTYNLILEGLPEKEIPVSRQHAVKLRKMFGL